MDFNIIKNQGDKKELLSYINSEEAFKNLDYKTAKLLETIMKVDIPNDGGYNMCKAIEDIKNDVTKTQFEIMVNANAIVKITPKPNMTLPQV